MYVDIACVLIFTGIKATDVCSILYHSKSNNITNHLITYTKDNFISKFKIFYLFSVINQNKSIHLFKYLRKKMVKLAFVVLVAFSLVDINNAFEIQPKIVRGYSAESGQFPFYAFLEAQYRNPMEVSACGATLISDQWLITAAHCLCDVNKLTVHLGKTVLNRPERSHVPIPVGRNNFFIFPGYKPEDVLHDIGLHFSKL